MGNIELFIYHTHEDDPKKCTARKLAKFKLAKIETNIKKISRNTVLLNPLAEKSLSKTDKKTALKNGITAVDCSWENTEKVFHRLNKTGNPRAIPFVLATNPVNYGKPFKLTTLEAFAAALYILDEKKQAEKILGLYKWSPHFLKLNKEPLEEYRKASDSAEIIKIMKHYF